MASPTLAPPPIASELPAIPVPGTGAASPPLDRRLHGGRVSPPKKKKPLWRSIAEYGGIVLACVTAIVMALGMMRPVFVGKAPVAKAIVSRETATHPHTPWAPRAQPTRLDSVMATADFQEQRRRFREDLFRTGRISAERADSIALYAVREAYIHGVAPALIFGVMLTENSRFVSGASSNVGAVGLMQVYPKIWLRVFGKKYGTDLTNDETNLRYGVAILNEYLSAKKRGQSISWQQALLRYNGCVRGSNTPNCHTYPSKVQGYVQREAKSLCEGMNLVECFAAPIIKGLTGEDLTVTTSAGDVATPPASKTTAPAPATTTPTPTTAAPPPTAPATVAPTTSSATKPAATATRKRSSTRTTHRR